MKRKLSSGCGALVWFRNDLRVHDNKALFEASEYIHAKNFANSSDAQLLGIFVISEAEMKLQNYGYAKFDFILRCLEKLKGSLADLGIPLLVTTLDKENSTNKDYGEHLATFCHEHGLDAIFFNKETNPVAQTRDLTIKPILDSMGIGYRDFADQCIVPEGFVMTKEGKPYSMFTPFKNSWITYLKDRPLSLLTAPRPMSQSFLLSDGTIDSKTIESFSIEDLDIKQVQLNYPAGEQEAINRQKSFLTSIGAKYDETRNFPAMTGTSQLSPYLAIGALSPRMALEDTRLANDGRLDSGKSGFISFISELCWRDFYRHILHHFPHVSNGEPFKPEAKNIEWREGKEANDDFDAWCDGRTGVPIVDAAMMQLRRTSWMHNRLRMIVSMFLTKHLLISWRKGEEFFARHLIDYDFSSNNGGWQWSSSTGTDSQPYFRIFNPYTQSENYDKEGKFIKKFLSELANVPRRAIHNPNQILKPDEKQKLCPEYPKTIVEHKFARNRALEVYKKAFKVI